jgi:two-component system LytT family response regulator
VRNRGSARIPVPTADGELWLDAGEIDWIAARDDHLEIHAGERCYRLRETLGAVAARLDPARFVRVHRSALVRLDQVRALVAVSGSGEWRARLRDGTQVPVSRRRLAVLKALLRPPDH